MKTHKSCLALIATTVFFVALFSISCKDNPESLDQNTRPIAAFIITPAIGTPDTIFVFDATKSTDEETPDSLLIRWDFNDDKCWDIDWSTERIQMYQYEETGTYSVRLEVMDESGWINDLVREVIVLEN